MGSHEFLFNPGIWVGEGKITLNTSPEHLRFYTKWNIEKPDKKQKILCSQEVEMQGSEESVVNQLTVFDVTPTKFEIILENTLIGQIFGKGIVDLKTIAWEFRGDTELEGFEVYELQDNGDYMLHAEYASPDSYRTTIDGRIWKKST